VTNDAIIEIIFDNNTGEVLRSQGAGALQIYMSRTGVLTMYGDYSISKGDYLFTNFKVIKKPFELLPAELGQQGSQIHWDGDPYNADMYIRARYKGLTAPVYPLIQDILPKNASLINEARERTEVDLTMILSGNLTQPNIDFDISFPNLSGEISGYANNKINSLKANQRAILEQVVGLLLAKSFLPSSIGLTAGLVATKGINNTLSEFISSTLSSYLSGLLADIIPEGQVISGVGLEVGVSLPLTQGGIVDQSGDLEDPNTTEFGINLPIEFFNDRLTVTVGGNYVSGATFLQESQYFAGDVVVEYNLSADGSLKLRMYNRNDQTIQGRKNKVGVGVAFRKEYDSFREIFGKKKKKPAEPPVEEAEGG
ncbi:MAG: translocation/assembly module TamB, partial [Bacteroidota bacterium]|nr:translocation/assembly module TamB [Bacteroidota bacterium]